MNIIGYRKIFYLISGALIIVSIASVVLWRFRVGIDFVGGSFWEVDFHESEVDEGRIQKILQDVGVVAVLMQRSGETGYVLRFHEIDEAKHQLLLTGLGEVFPEARELRFETVGPTIGATLRKKAAQSVVVVLFTISLYIAWAFRRVSRPIASWKYGVVTVLTLFHDIAITIGLFSMLGKLFGVEVDSNFIVALLVVMGFSVHDTIVVFDRIRENLKKAPPGENFPGVVNRSLNQTFSRSVNTSLTVLLTLAALFFYGPGSLQFFVLALFVGIFAGTYSSIFIASPILVELGAWQRKRANRAERGRKK